MREKSADFSLLFISFRRCLPLSSASVAFLPVSLGVLFPFRQAVRAAENRIPGLRYEDREFICSCGLQPGAGGLPDPGAAVSAWRFARVLIGNTGITLSGAFALALGIAIQNFPEGAIISMPLCSLGVSKKRAFLYGVLSGLVEPVGAMITILLTGIIVPFLPYFLSFAAGAMIYVVVEELIPESQMGEHTNIATIGVAVGFTLMMVLDVALG